MKSEAASLPARRWTIWLGWLLLWGVALALAVPMYYRQQYQTISDFPAHAMFAKAMVQQGRLQTPHFLWQVLVAGIIFIGRGYRYYLAAVVLACGVYLLLATILCKMLRHDYAAASLGNRIILPVVGALGIIIAAPIFLPYAFDPHLYFGYIGLATYHNPTILLLKPLAILHFWLALRAFTPGRLQLQDLLATLVTLIGAALAKPNYGLCILPTLGLAAAYWLYIGRPVKWTLLLAGTIVPLVGILIWQWWFSYNSRTTMSASSIVIEPFGVMRHYSSNLLIKFICSIAFPAAVYSWYWAEARRNLTLNMAWLLFAFGATMTYLLAESGGRRNSANFFWSSQIALFVLFVASYRFSIHQWGRTAPTWRSNLLLGGIFSLHVISGVVFYIAEFSTHHTYW